jgi:hypothetical protein
VTPGITPAQRAALEALSPILEAGTYLAGGVAVALLVGHRMSRDLDLFAGEVDPDQLAQRAASLAGSTIVSRAPGTLYLEIGGVPTSIIGYKYPLLRQTARSRDIAIEIAAPEDLVCMKLSAIASRGAKRDFWDLSVLLAHQGLDVPGALDLYRQKYAAEDIGHVVRSLVYFGDAEAEPSPAELSSQEWQRVKTAFVAAARALS